MDPREIIRHELIGLKLRVMSSSNQLLIGLEGKVIDETRNTLTVETKAGPRTIIKDQCEFAFFLPTGGIVRVDGKLLVGRPEDRIKKRIRGW